MGAITAKPYNRLERILKVIFKGKPYIFSSEDYNKEISLKTDFISTQSRISVPGRINCQWSVEFNMSSPVTVTDRVPNPVSINLQYSVALTKVDSSKAAFIASKGVFLSMPTNILDGSRNSVTVAQGPDNYIADIFLIARKRTIEYADDPVLCGVTSEEYPGSLPSCSVEVCDQEELAINFSGDTYTVPEGKEIICRLGRIVFTDSNFTSSSVITGGLVSSLGISWNVSPALLDFSVLDDNTESSSYEYSRRINALENQVKEIWKYAETLKSSLINSFPIANTLRPDTVIISNSENKLSSTDRGTAFNRNFGAAPSQIPTFGEDCRGTVKRPLVMNNGGLELSDSLHDSDVVTFNEAYAIYGNLPINNVGGNMYVYTGTSPISISRIQSAPGDGTRITIVNASDANVSIVFGNSYSGQYRGIITPTSESLVVIPKNGSANFRYYNSYWVYQGSNPGQSYTKILPIGDWNMDVTATLYISHGLPDFKKVRHITAIVRNDQDSEYLSFQGIGGQCRALSENIQLDRIDGATFDNSNFDTVPYNRGWVYLEVAP